MFLENIRIEKDNFNYFFYNEKIEIYRFWEKSKEELLKDFNNNIFKKDFIGTIFFFLSGYWEYINDGEKDKYNRFLYKNSFLYLKEIELIPVVDCIVENIKNKYGLSYRVNKPVAFITHDIDNLGFKNRWYLLKTLLGKVIKKKNFDYFSIDFVNLLKRNNPVGVENLINIHKKYKTKATYFFLPKIQKQTTPGGYNLKSNYFYLKNLFKKIKKNNSEIALHYDTNYIENDNIKKSINKLQGILNIKVKSGRAHYLIFDINKSFEKFQNSNNIFIDSTISFAENIGFRFGTSRAFMPFDFENQKKYNFVEIPLIIMDVSLKNKNYMNLNIIEAKKTIENLIYEIKKVNGFITILWHNTSFYFKEWEQWSKLLEETIIFLCEEKFQFMTFKEIYDKYYKDLF